MVSYVHSATRALLRSLIAKEVWGAICVSGHSKMFSRVEVRAAGHKCSSTPTLANHAMGLALCLLVSVKGNRNSTSYSNIQYN